VASLQHILLGNALKREEDSSEGQEGGGTQRRLIAYCCNPCEIPGTVYADADDDSDKAAGEIAEIAENPAAVVGEKVMSPHRSIDIGAASVCEVTSDYGSRNALIWAVSTYNGAPDLPNAIEDGVRLRSMLLRLGWNVTFLADVIKAKAQESLREFRCKKYLLLYWYKSTRIHAHTTKQSLREFRDFVKNSERQQCLPLRIRGARP
jgi:hypothetical protein